MNPNKMPLYTPLECTECRWCWCRRCAIVFCELIGGYWIVCVFFFCCFLFSRTINAENKWALTESEKLKRRRKNDRRKKTVLTLSHKQAAATKTTKAVDDDDLLFALTRFSNRRTANDWRDHHKLSLNIVIRFVHTHRRKKALRSVSIRACTHAHSIAIFVFCFMVLRLKMMMDPALAVKTTTTKIKVEKKYPTAKAAMN